MLLRLLLSPKCFNFQYNLLDERMGDQKKPILFYYGLAYSLFILFRYLLFETLTPGGYSKCQLKKMWMLNALPLIFSDTVSCLLIATAVWVIQASCYWRSVLFLLSLMLQALQLLLPLLPSWPHPESPPFLVYWFRPDSPGWPCEWAGRGMCLRAC